MRTVLVQSIAAYKAPHGWRIVSVHQLMDGSYEVTLEPLAWYL